MMTAVERSDLIHLMKMNCLALSDRDTVQFDFGVQV